MQQEARQNMTSVTLQRERAPFAKADSTQRSSQAVPHPSTNRALRHLTSEFRRDPVHSTRYGRQRPSISEEHRTALLSVPERAHRYSATLLPCCPAMLLTSSHHGKKKTTDSQVSLFICASIGSEGPNTWSG